jgi:hypothetical protein
MLFDCYVSLLQNYDFADAQNRMKDYLVASYKVTPALPTFVEARDALLQVVAASSAEDYDRFGQAFAGRGLGIGAVAPDRGSGNNAGVVESFDWGNNYRIQSVALVDGGTNCDGDGVLDPGETGAVEVTIRNIGKTTLSGVTATASSGTAAASFPAPGPTATFAVAPGSLGTVHTSLAATATDTSVAVTLVTGTVDTGGRRRRAHRDPLANLDEVTTQDTDTFATVNSNWSILVEPHTQQPPPGTVWFRALGDADSPDGTAFVATTNVQSDESVLTPPIHVAATGDFIVSWKHIYADLAGPPTVSGVVVEISDDDGATWTDMAAVAGAAITNGYNDTIATEDPALGSNQRNPLEGREAFTGVSPLLGGGTFAFDEVSANFHAAFAGKTVLVRFRYGSPFDQFDTQWLYELDDVTVSGVTEHPFLEDVTDQAICVPIPDAGPDQEVNEQSVATLHGAATDLAGPVTHTWTQLDGPAVALGRCLELPPTFTAPLGRSGPPLTFS